MDESTLQTPSKGLDTMLGPDSSADASSAAEDSLLGHPLLQRGSLGRSSGSEEAPSESETPEQVQAQLSELRQLNDMFESYESALRGSLAQISVSASRYAR